MRGLVTLIAGACAVVLGSGASAQTVERATTAAPRVAAPDLARRVPAGKLRASMLSAQPLSLRAGQPVSLQLSLQSSAGAALQNVPWQITATRAATTTVIARGNVPVLAPGSSTLVTAQWVAQTGVTQLRGIVDPDNSAGEPVDALGDNRSNTVTLQAEPAMRLDAATPAQGGAGSRITLIGDGFTLSPEPINVFAREAANPNGPRRQINYDQDAILSRSNQQLAFRVSWALGGPTDLLLDVESASLGSNVLAFRWVPVPERRWIELGYSYGHDRAGPHYETRVRLAGDKSVQSAQWYNSRYARYGYPPVMPSAPHYLVVNHMPRASADPRVAGAPDSGVDDILPGVVLQNGCVLDAVEFKPGIAPPVVGGSVTLEPYAIGSTNANIRVRWTRRSGAMVGYHLAIALRHPGTSAVCGPVATVPFDRRFDSG